MECSSSQCLHLYKYCTVYMYMYRHSFSKFFPARLSTCFKAPYPPPLSPLPSAASQAMLKQYPGAPSSLRWSRFFWCFLLVGLLLLCAKNPDGVLTTKDAPDSVPVPGSPDLGKQAPPIKRYRDRDKARLQGLPSSSSSGHEILGVGKEGGLLTTTVKVPFHGFPPSQPQAGTRWSMSDYPKLVRHDTRRFFPAGDIFIQTIVPEGVFNEADHSEVLWHGVCPHGTECADDVLLMHHLTLMYWSKDSYNKDIEFDPGHAHG